MTDILEIAGDILFEKERTELTAKYNNAVDEGDWKEAHDALWQWAKIVVPAYQEQLARAIKMLEAKLG